jgi:hypothetical protein
MGLHFSKVNADDIKADLREYRGWNAAAVHEESSLIAEGPLMARAQDQRHNILLDATGANAVKMAKLATEFGENGYEVRVIGVTLPSEKAMGRAWERFRGNAFDHAPYDAKGKRQDPGRFVPPPYVHHDVDGKPDKTYEVLKQNPYVKSWVKFSNDVPFGAPPIELDRGQR